jgi:hypothetical protein
MSDGSIQNNYELKINNKMQVPLELRLDVEGLKGSEVTIGGGFKDLHIPADQTRNYHVHVRASRASGVARQEIIFKLIDEHGHMSPITQGTSFNYK